APVAVALIAGPDFTFDFVNPAYERMVSRQRIEGRRLIDVFPEVQDQGILELLRSIYESGQPFENPEMRVEFVRAKGEREEAWFNVRVQPYVQPGGVRGLLAVAVEVTEHVKGRQELDSRRSELAAREKTSALGQLVSGVAHEIRTPLTYLATNLNLIQLRLERLTRALPREQAEASRMLVEQYIPSALEAADRINHIVEDLRRFTQGKVGVREPARLDDVVSQAVSLFQATHHGRVEVRLDAQASPLLRVDRLQVQQAVLNLLQNALEARPRDHAIVVRTRQDASQATIEVADRGVGIPAEAQARIFDPFFTTRTGGTGLGLSIVKRVVEEHRGSVEFETGPEGTTFRLALPLDG
ncbi:MAG TPA: ATP-binding protein, partial [Candidatus Thermoplasmatota archaeon]|nr:ATP-binding protein [Candidatus Thermoplasmatota archaeon]